MEDKLLSIVAIFFNLIHKKIYNIVIDSIMGLMISILYDLGDIVCCS